MFYRVNKSFLFTHFGNTLWGQGPDAYRYNPFFFFPERFYSLRRCSSSDLLYLFGLKLFALMHLVRYSWMKPDLANIKKRMRKNVLERQG